MSAAADSHRRRQGVIATLIAFTIWGLMPLYFKAVGSVSPGEIVAHRVLWSVVFLLALLALWRGFDGLRRVAAQPRLIGLLALSSTLTGSNWLVFVWAIAADKLLEASLGYFINPLVSILLGRLVLGERLRPLQQAAVALACAGVAWRVWQVGTLPWIALFLAITFGLYGLLRKRAPVDAINGLFVETLVTAPLAIGWLAWLASRGTLQFGQALATDALLPLAGVLTAVPLMLFAIGAQRLPLSTVGFVQYLAPSINFLLAVFVFHEPFDAGQLAGFALIWAALAVYSVDMLRANRATR
ncbi:EamA family transporter RarD [Aromatoleum toluclasticum]|uniref:EamA family transporter RarD n=1 Tax=Aromatoleum toluclasticum TaxID=92003 RepID=UPI001D186F61|nr:EamA family transporter RarD [Aromatoleum toluclasticum]MCC4115402.1 EamA family transporter RarD [Aromatoleum toluclasticum]